MISELCFSAARSLSVRIVIMKEKTRPHFTNDDTQGLGFTSSLSPNGWTGVPPERQKPRMWECFLWEER